MVVWHEVIMAQEDTGFQSGSEKIKAQNNN